MEKNCDNCTGSKSDREVALKKYLKLFEVAKGTEQERILVQIVQMNILLDNSFRRESFFKKIIKGKSYGQSLKARATLALAEMYFHKGKFKDAYTYFGKAIGLKRELNTTITQYRMAWCDLNLGRITKAKSKLIQLLKNPKSFSKDPTLRTDMSQDLARFLAKNTVKNSDLNLLKSLSPKGEEKENLKILASELDRLGKSKSFAQVNGFILKNFKATSLEKAKMSVDLARSQYSNGQKTLASQSFASAMNNFSLKGCKPKEECDDYKEAARKLVVSWRQDVKLKPTRRALGVFGSYLGAVRSDYEMAYWGGQMAEDLKNWETAQKHYQQAAVALKTSPDRTKNQKLLSEAALSAIRTGEKTKKNNLRREAYRTYLSVLPNGAQAYDSRYQLAYIDYQEKKNTKAKSEFKTLISEYKAGKAKGKTKVAQKGADLVLDILAQEKNNDQIMQHSEEYLKLFPSQRKAYSGIYRKAAYNQASVDIKGSSASKHKKSLQRLKKISFRDVEDKEQIKLLKLQNSLAEKVKDLKEVDRTALKLLGYKSIDKKTAQFATNQRIWVAETTLNFKKAYNLTKNSIKGRASKKQSLKLGALAELAGLNAKVHYEAALKNKNGTLEANQIRAKIVRSSRAPWKEIKNRLSKMKGSPQLLSELALETYTRYANVGSAEKVLAAGSVSKKPAGLVLRRHLEMPKFVTLATNLKKHNISTRSDSQLQKDLQKRISMIEEMNDIANKAISRGDTPIKLVTLEVLKLENQRLHKDLLGLPVPKGLDVAGRQQYMSLIQQKAKPYQARSLEISSRLSGLWNSQKYVSSLEADAKVGTAIAKDIITREALFLLPYAPENYQGRLRKLSVREKPALALKTIESKVKANPFQKSHLDKYRQLAYYLGRHATVAYIDQRLLQIREDR